MPKLSSYYTNTCKYDTHQLRVIDNAQLTPNRYCQAMPHIKHKLIQLLAS